MLAGPLNQLVQLVLDSELVGLWVPNLPMGATRPFPDSLWRTFWTVLKLRPVDSTSIETVCFMLPTRKAWSRTRASGLLMKTEDKGPAVSYLTFMVSISHDFALSRSLEFIPMYIEGRRAANGILCSPLLV